MDQVDKQASKRLLTCNRFRVSNIVWNCLIYIFMVQRHTSAVRLKYIFTFKVVDKICWYTRHTNTFTRMEQRTQVQRYHIFTVHGDVSCQLPFSIQQSRIMTLDSSILHIFTYNFRNFLEFFVLKEVFFQKTLNVKIIDETIRHYPMKI